jgi:hypothetical protein
MLAPFAKRFFKKNVIVLFLFVGSPSGGPWKRQAKPLKRREFHECQNVGIGSTNSEGALCWVGSRYPFRAPRLVES